MKRIGFGIFFVLTISFFPSFASAEGFEIYLFYDQQKERLDFDRSKPASVSVVTEGTVSIIDFNNPPTQGPFEYVFFDVTDAEMFSVQFTPKNGSFTIELPYFSIAKTLKIRRVGEMQYFLQQDISNLMSCNANGICEFEKKETESTCIVDCASSHVTFSPETQKVLDQSGGVLRDKETGIVLLRGVSPTEASPPTVPTTESRSVNIVVLAIGVIVLFLVGIGIWVIIRLRRRNRRYGL